MQDQKKSNDRGPKIHPESNGAASFPWWQKYQNQFRDRKFRFRILAALILLVLAGILATGIFSYQVGKREMLLHTDQTVRNIVHEGSRNLEDRLMSYEENTYQIMRTESVSRILSYTTDEAFRSQARNEGLSAAITQQSILYTYTRAARLRTNSGYIYEYDRYREKKKSQQEVDALFETADQSLSFAHPIRWIRFGEDVVFLRKYVNTDLEEQGTLLFWVDDSFFGIVGDDFDFLTNENLLIQSADGEKIKGAGDDLSRIILEHIKLSMESRYARNTIPFEKSTINEEENSHGENSSYRKDTYIATTLITPNKHWTMTIFFSERELLKGLRRIYQAVAVFLVVAALLGIVVAGLLAQALSGNLKRIETNAIKIVVSKNCV